MVSSKTVVLAIAVTIAMYLTNSVNGSPAISFGKRFDNIDYIQICLNNCAQCKRMFGDYFQGQNCAESCLKHKGRAIPDCEDIGSIAQFLNKYE